MKSALWCRPARSAATAKFKSACGSAGPDGLVSWAAHGRGAASTHARAARNARRSIVIEAPATTGMHGSSRAASSGAFGGVDVGGAGAGRERAVGSVRPDDRRLRRIEAVLRDQ